MLSLHNATALTKNIIKWVVIAIIALLLFVLIIRIGAAIKNFLFPTPPPPPTVRFGKLPKVPFKESVTKEKLAYSLNTIAGDLPAFSDRVNVYIVSHPNPSLLDLNRAKEKVGKVGFKGRETKVFDNIYEWKGGSELSINLILNIVTQDFKFTSPFLTNLNTINTINLPNERGAIDLSLGFLQDISAQTDDFDQSKVSTELFAIKNTTFVPASSLSNAQLIRVDFYQKDIDKLPIYYPNPPHSLINFLIVSGSKSPVIVEGNYFHQRVSEISSTYPIKTAHVAYEELQNGKAYIASFLGTNNNVVITDVFLAYYLTDEIQKYLMPIIVFKGENEFYAYVSAITDSHILQ